MKMSKQIFKMNRTYKQFATMFEAEHNVHSLSNPSKMETYGYSISALECKMGGILFMLKDTVCADCYARKGRYIFPDVQHALDMRLDKINNNPLWVDAMIYLISNKKRNGKPLSRFRWHDSGDIQSEHHLNMICEVAQATPNVNHWLPTKEVAIVRNYIKTHKIPKNLNVRISAYKINGKPIKLKGTTTSMVVSKIGKDKRKSNTDCPIYADDSHGKTCGSCYACYDRLITNVTYLKH